MKNVKKVMSLLLILAMCLSSFAACSKKKDVKDEKAKDVTTEVTKGAEKETAEKAGEETPLVVGYSPFSEKFSPFFSDTDFDTDVVRMTAPELLTTDRAGGIIYHAIEGETVPYNGTDYTYKGIADFDVNIDEATNKTTYDIKLRDDVKFSDGEALTADDVIFSYYVYCDTSYDGGATLSSMPIVGLKNYRANSTLADSITKEDVEKVLAKPSEALNQSIIDTIIRPTLESEYEWAGTLYGDDGYAEYTKKYPEQKDLFAFFYSKDEKYDSTKVSDAKQVVEDIIAQYGADYKTLGTNYGGDEAYYAADVNTLAEAAIVEEKKAAGEGEEVPNIEGIKKISDTEVQVVTEGYDAAAIYQIGYFVAPLHYYGDKAAYDYENNKFGFTRGDLSSVKEKTTKPLGAGPYKFIKYENKVVYFEANENYYKGQPKTKYVQFKETLEDDKVTGIEQGTIDVTDPTGSKTAFEQIAGLNSNGEISGDKVVTNTVDNLGYGYIGMNSDTVNVGGEPDSDASKNLRKALATILSVYRDVTIDTYYGEAASVINYPISNTSWAAPQKSDSDYQIAYSKDVSGNDIYTTEMSQDEKYAAALKAALGYFEAAGYTVKDGKLTAAPKGAKMEYQVMIPADGVGNHPSFAILTDASAALKTIGFTLTVNDLADSNVLWDSLDAGTQELWAAAWQATIDPDMYQVYHSSNIVGQGGTDSNHYHITDSDLDELMVDARQSADIAYRKSAYKQCLDIILDWAVEIPVYQRQNCILSSVERVNMDTFTPDITTFYPYIKEVENIEMN